MTEPQRQAPDHRVRSSLVLLLTAFIWGIAFVAQRVGMGYIGPFLFAGLRFWLGAATLGLVLLVTRRRSAAAAGAAGAGAAAGAGTAAGDGAAAADGRLDARRLLRAGAACGACLFSGGILQQVGLVYTTASKAGFLTALYIVLVPVLGMLVRHKTHWNTWMGVALAVAGLYFLSIKADFTIELGDVVVIIGAFFWAGHILCVDHFVAGLGQHEVLRICVAQFIFAGSLGLAFTPFCDRLFVEQPFDIQALASAALPILYAGVLSTGVAFTLQAIGQQGLPPAAAAIIMSLEAVFSVLGGMVLLGEAMTSRELLGCGLMFASVILAQLPLGRAREA